MGEELTVSRELPATGSSWKRRGGIGRHLCDVGANADVDRVAIDYLDDLAGEGTWRLRVADAGQEDRAEGGEADGAAETVMRARLAVAIAG